MLLDQISQLFFNLLLNGATDDISKSCGGDYEDTVLWDVAHIYENCHLQRRHTSNSFYE
jgi:hypothetical protein